MRTKKRLLCSLAFCTLIGGVLQAQEQVIRFTTAKPVGEKITLTVNHMRDGVRVDWGDGNVQTYTGTDHLQTVEGQVKGSTITVTGGKGFTTFICDGQEMTELNLRKAHRLRSLYCPNNQLQAVDFSSTPMITDINLSNNQLTTVYLNSDISAHVENLNLANNKLSKIGTTWGFQFKDERLQNVNIANNEFTSANISKLPYLDRFIASNNKISLFDLQDAESVGAILIDGNRIKNVKISPDTRFTNLTQFIADDNKIPSLNLESATHLQDLSVSNNGMTELLLPRTKLQSMRCAYNNLSFRGLPANEYKPEEDKFSYQPMGKVILDSRLKRKTMQANNYYVDVCPDFSERMNKAYVIDFSDLRKDGKNWGTTQITWYKLDSNNQPVALTAATTSATDGEYYDSYGKTVFLKPQNAVFAVLTNPKNYPGFEIYTTGFAVGEDHIVDGIHDVVTDQKEQTAVYYDLQGRRVNEPQHGQIYILNGKKVFIK